MDLRPLEIFSFFQCCDHLYTPQSDINKHQVVTYKEGPRNVRVKDKTTCIIKRLLFTCLGMVIPLSCCIKKISDIAYIDRKGKDFSILSNALYALGELERMSIKHLESPVFT